MRTNTSETNSETDSQTEENSIEITKNMYIS